MYQALWSKNPAVPPTPSLLPEDWEERLSFLQGFESISKNKLRGPLGKAVSLAKRFFRIKQGKG
jgi:hypothetical protein